MKIEINAMKIQKSGPQRMRNNTVLPHLIVVVQEYVVLPHLIVVVQESDSVPTGHFPFMKQTKPATAPTIQ